MVATRRKKGGELDTSTDEVEDEIPLGSFGAISKDAGRNIKISGLPESTLEGGAEFGNLVNDLIDKMREIERID